MCIAPNTEGLINVHTDDPQELEELDNKVTTHKS